MEKSYLFIYGTLKRGLSRAHVMSDQRFVGEARTVPKYRMFNCGAYPAMVASPEDGVSIEGELWEVDSDCLTRLDVVEGVQQNLYARREVELESPFEQQDVQTYLYQRIIIGLPDCGSLWDSV